MRLELELKNSTWAKSPLMKLVSIKEDVGVPLDLSGHEICFVHKIGCDLGGHDIRFRFPSLLINFMVGALQASDP